MLVGLEIKPKIIAKIEVIALIASSELTKVLV